jgi:two-component sensor histidine kinase
MLTSAQTQAVAMVIHELVTNGAKHGALSNPDGRVSVSSSRIGAEGIVIIWGAISRFRNDRSSAALGSTTTHVAPLGVVSGLLDAIGGGGWG